MKFRSSRTQICQWCVGLLSEKPIDPDRVLAKFDALIEMHVEKLCSPLDIEDYKNEVRVTLGYPKQIGFFESIFNKTAVNQRETQIVTLATQRRDADVAKLNSSRVSVRADAVKAALNRNVQPKITKFGYRGWAKTEDLIPPSLVKYINAINLSLVSGTSKSDRPDKIGWERLRKQVLEEDRYRCMLCDIYPKEKHVHHIIPISKFGSNHPNNLITLCHNCHDKVHPDIKVTSYAT